ncbi:hypothetical protein [Mycolicibacterium alvei]|uniref:HTH araC/xylS-type domain-containing protein n=1 Tax=Mycolicibacterium alvei TaxID=67081 RepID=A0A6N4UYL8_9MYCO|nr:hypothetical protein [Mycolicibacterium alvei]BBX28777.1 hypothetical protein MALV_39020 [Mycolicibacterium alvei]
MRSSPKAARLLTESLAETVRLHLVDQFGDGAARAPRSRGFGRLTRAKLMEYLEHSLDSDISLALASLTEMTIAEFSAAFTATLAPRRISSS